jgi:hypothetical protein
MDNNQLYHGRKVYNFPMLNSTEILRWWSFLWDDENHIWNFDMINLHNLRYMVHNEQCFEGKDIFSHNTISKDLDRLIKDLDTALENSKAWIRLF